MEKLALKKKLFFKYNDSSRFSGIDIQILEYFQY